MVTEQEYYLIMFRVLGYRLTRPITRLRRELGSMTRDTRRYVFLAVMFWTSFPAFPALFALSAIARGAGSLVLFAACVSQLIMACVIAGPYVSQLRLHRARSRLVREAVSSVDAEAQKLFGPRQSPP